MPDLSVRWPATGLFALAAVLTGCGSLDQASNRLVTVLSPYQIDIVQGNFVSREQAAALKPGMTRSQVRDLLGTPLLQSVFHADRWDYVFTFKRQGQTPQSRTVTVLFKGDVLASSQADDLPSETEFVASLDSGRPVGPVPVLEAPLAAASAPKAAGASAPPPLAPAPVLSAYPPLEPRVP